MDPNGIVELLTTMDRMKYLIAHQKQKLEESEQDLREIQTEWKVKSVEVQYGSTELEQTNNEVQNSVVELSKIIDDLVEAKKENSAINRKMVKQQKIKLSSKDLDKLQQSRETYDMYKRITGVRWNFVDIDHCVEGAVTNKKDYVQAFSYPINAKGLESKLWREIEKSCLTINAEEEEVEK